MTKDEALKLALEALKQIDEAMPFPVAKLAQAAIKEALAQPEHGWTPERIAGMARLKEAQDKKLAQPKREPVAWINSSELLVMKGNAYAGAKDWRVNLGLEPEDGDVGLYTTPPQRTWVGLTDEEIEALAKKHNGIFYDCDIDFARAIEAKLKAKNSL